ncbi:SGNH/GDSL hydrolase family protein [Adhaeribacter radiodurans]|uniref:SGNH/GDSL hydrolase family protein n=1 Tax=Adhaeribacter radiodurans TaxID=2745197 RepID=A0A7L7L4S5_9BACT|nr:SGNH/GDSL hydrolase family protein [Adhaeribacter radiodurans]QMU27774.1 SGNH/GDSL hydrolase family protein [Adhaeribacter radiodurans]
MKKFFLLIFPLFFFSSFNTTKTLTWVAIGDSITYLNDHPDETGNRITKGYLTGVTEKLPELEYVNKGYNGWTAVRIAEEIEKLGLAKADVYSVFLGTNDWWQGKPIGTLADYQNNTGTNTFYGSYRIIINKLRELNKKAPIILITPMQRVDFVYINNMKNNAYGSYKDKNGQSLAAFAAAINAIGKLEKLSVVDLYNQSGITLETLVKFKRLKDPANGQYKNYSYPDFINVPFNPETDVYPYPPESVDNTYDGLHPSDKGYEVITNMVAQALKKELKIRKASKQAVLR